MDPAQADKEWADLEAHEQALRQALMACLPRVNDAAARAQCPVGQVKQCIDGLYDRLDRLVCDNREASLSEDEMRSQIDQHFEQSK